jgi:hypothetical protein
MAAEIQAGQCERVPEPAVEKEYGIQAVTNRIDDLYDMHAARRHWRTVLRTSRPASAGPMTAAPAATAPAGTGSAGTVALGNGSPAPAGTSRHTCGADLKISQE